MNYSIPKRIFFSLFVGILTLSFNVVNAQCPTAVTITAPASKFCPGGNVILTATVTGGSGNFTYVWRNQLNTVVGSSSTFLATTNGFYTVRVTDNTNFCSRTSPGYEVGVSPKAIVTVSGPLTFCAGNSVTLTADSTADYSFQWRNSLGNISADTFSSLIVTADEEYTVVVTDVILGCSVTSAMQDVIVHPTSVAGTLSGTSSICIGATAPSLTLTGYTGNVILW
jgi:hypothetical protein